MSESSYVWTDDPLVSKYYLFSSLHMSHYFGVIIIIALAMYYNLIVGPESPSS